MDEKEKALQALEGASMLEILRSQGVTVDEEIEQVDEQALAYEIDNEFQSQQVNALEHQLSKFVIEQGRASQLLDTALQQKQVLEKKKIMLAEICDSFEGCLDLNKTQFFTQSQELFADAHHLGEMSLGDLIESSDNGFSLNLDGNVYCFLRESQGKVWFHPDPFPFLKMLDGPEFNFSRSA